MKLLAILTLLLASSTENVNGIPMVENSVKFALERCKQFLHLAEFLQPEALNENVDIRRTKKVCDHIVLVEDDFNSNDIGEISNAKTVQTESLVDKPVKMLALRKESPVAPLTDRKHVKKEEQNCYVHLFRRQHFQGKAIVLSKNLKDTVHWNVKSVRVLGPCSWRFFNRAGFQGEHFTVDGNSSWDDKNLATLAKWGWKVGSLKSVKKLNKKNRKKHEFWRKITCKYLLKSTSVQKTAGKTENCYNWEVLWVLIWPVFLVVRKVCEVLCFKVRSSCGHENMIWLFMAS